MAAQEEKAAPTVGFVAGIKRDLAGLADAPRELWLVFAIKFFESVAFFAIYNLIAVYLTTDLGYGDVAAGTIAGTWLTAVSVLTFFAGVVADGLGVRRSLLISVLSCLIGRALLASSSARPVAFAGIAVMTWGVAAMFPTMTAAVRGYTRKETVSFGFSLFYVMMNLGAFVAPRTIGWFRRNVSHGATLDLPLVGASHFTSSRLIFLVGVAVTAVATALVLAMRPDEVVRRESGAEEPAHRDPPWKALRDLAAEKAFWRFMLFVTLLVFVRLIFQHAHLTWPKYTMREFGDTFGWADLWSLNPLMIMLFTPVATAFTRNLSAFKCIVAGSLISACSVFFMAASTTVAASYAFVVALSVGEMLWSPRLYEYTSTIAPRGREASYMGLSQVPFFFAKPVVGSLSGVMLSTWCPATGPRESGTMWLAIGLMTLVGPLAIWMLRDVISPPAQRADAPAA